MLATMLLVAGLTSADLAPGVEFDPSVPTLKEVVGHDLGAEITQVRDITAYLKALAEAAPERTKLVGYAKSWEGRPLHVLIVGSPENIARLDEIRDGMQRLADPRSLEPGEEERLTAELPVGVWLMHAVHGNEISSPDAAMAEAWYLLAARGDEKAERILRDALVIIDPLQNPDGRARFVHHNRAGQAAEPDTEPVATEHDEPWPRGRSNHYLFDMNRDWLALTQPETRGRIALFLEYFPPVSVDLHEMGGNATYYFAPAAPPDNPFISERQFEWWETIGRANAERFDERGFAYFVREVFDSFYPGYGESWPLFHGSVGMTYEQASARGLRFRRDDETILTFGQGIVQHFTAAIETAHTSALNRKELLRDFVAYRRAAVSVGADKAYVLDASGDPGQALRLGRLLQQHGIEVQRAKGAFEAASASYPAGTLVVAQGQPAGFVASNLLDPDVPMDDEFIAEQRRRLNKRLRDQIYDMTAWSLPLLFDVEAKQIKGIRAELEPLPGEAAEAAALPSARVGYLVPWNAAGAAATAEALRTGLKGRVAGKPFTLGGRRYPGGTALFRTPANEADLAERLGAIAVRHGAEVVATDSGWVDDGISLGSMFYRPAKAPKVVLAWDEPTWSLSAGWARYVLERRFAQPVTTVRVSSLRYLDWDRYDVLVLPSGDYEDVLGGGTLRAVKSWVSGGGTLITLGEASRWAAREDSELLDTRTELRDGSPEVEPDGDEEKRSGRSRKEAGDDEPFDLEAAIQPEKERPEATPGALLRVELDAEHWLSFGTDGEIQAVVESQRIFTPITLDKGTNVGIYAAGDRLVAGGLVWEQPKKSLARKAFLIHQPMGRGHLVAFAEDPNYRGFAEATELLFLNAVILGTAF